MLPLPPHININKTMFVVVVAAILVAESQIFKPYPCSSHHRIVSSSQEENQLHRLDTSYRRFSWTMNQSGSRCSSSTCSRSRSLTFRSTVRPLTTRWRTSILTFSSIYSTWRVQRRHWREITMHKSWSFFVTIDSMGHWLSPWIKTKPLINWSVLHWQTCNW